MSRLRIAIVLLIFFFCGDNGYAQCKCDTPETFKRYVQKFSLIKNDKTCAFCHTTSRYLGGDGKVYIDVKIPSTIHSYYYNYKTANVAIRRSLIANQDKILEWLTKKEDQPLIITNSFKESIGYGFIKVKEKHSSLERVIMHNCKLMLYKNNNCFVVLVSYPID